MLYQRFIDSIPVNKKIIGIYKITNTITNEVYIGQSKDIRNRLLKHKSNQSKCKINININSYDIKNFDIEILEELQYKDISLLDDLERYYISLVPKDKLLNVQTGGLFNFHQSILISNNETLKNIIKLLLNDNIAINEIANTYNVSPRLIYYINNGKFFNKFDNIKYPIRTKIKTRILKNKCIICSNRFTTNNKKNIYCSQICFQKSRKSKVTYEDLINDLLLDLPLTVLANKYNISDNAYKKQLKKYNLPWSKRERKLYRNNAFR